ncbi:MAG: hypothetical protein QOG62_1344 [Thermoleophilaceae bacterium]|jgi:uncharacterized cupin superfamily protein|nr:hypothetical protein [Thermoleophilaceae bacterium]
MPDPDFSNVTQGNGFAYAHLDDLGDPYGFRKVRKGLGIEAFGANALVLPPGWETGNHFHDEQDELYFVHSGSIEMIFGDGSTAQLGPGCVAHVEAATVRRSRNTSDTEDAVILVIGAKGGYIGRDGRLPEGEERKVPGGPPGA